MRSPISTVLDAETTRTSANGCFRTSMRAVHHARIRPYGPSTYVSSRRKGDGSTTRIRFTVSPVCGTVQSDPRCPGSWSQRTRLKASGRTVYSIAPVASTAIPCAASGAAQCGWERRYMVKTGSYKNSWKHHCLTSVTRVFSICIFERRLILFLLHQCLRLCFKFRKRFRNEKKSLLWLKGWVKSWKYLVWLFLQATKASKKRSKERRKLATGYVASSDVNQEKDDANV